MDHGIQQFFHERARCRRRVSVTSASLSLVGLALLASTAVSPVGRALRENPSLRFGFEGPTRYVRLIQVESRPGTEERLRDVGKVVARPTRSGAGRGDVGPRRRETPGPSGRVPLTEGGPGPQTLLARALSGRGRVPIFQSEELIIEHLVEPVYPDDARNRGVEGRVEVLAHVSTSGEVVETEVITRSGEPQLDRAAVDAVVQCRFRPYLEGGEIREVYAIFRFRFTLH